MPTKARRKLKGDGFVHIDPQQQRQPASVSAPSTKAPAKRPGRPPKATIATKASLAPSSIQSTHAPTPTPAVATTSTTDMSAASAIVPGAADATTNVVPESTPAPTASKAGASPTRLLATTVQHNTRSLTKTVETAATVLAAAIGRGKRTQEEPQLDGGFNEKRARMSTAKKTTGPPNSANGWNKSSFSPPDDPTSVSLSAEEVSAKRKESARVVLDGILNRPITKTIQAYRTYFKLWKTFCDQNYDGDSTVSPTRMLEFFEKVVFERKVRKVVDPNTGYSGQIGIAATGAGLRKGRKSAQNKGQGTTTSVANPTVAPTESGPLQLGQCIEAVGNEDEAVGNDDEASNRSCARNSNGYSDDTCDNETAGSEDEAEDLSVEEQSSTDATAESLISSITEKNNVLQDGEKDAYGNTIIYVPVGFEAVDMARKALIFLWKEQCSRLAPLPSLEPNPRKDIPLMKAIDDYEVKLVYDSVNQSDHRATACSIRDPYTPSDFIRMLSFLWRELSPIQRKGKRTYNRTTRYQHMRERLCLLARHHMLLRDEDIRNANLSDTFSLLQRNSAAGSGTALGLVFCLPRGKTNKKGENMYATTFRHKNSNRCTVGGFAFYMFERFEIEKEPLPDFSKPDEWHRVKVLVGGSVKDRLDPRSSHYRFLPLDPKTQNDSTSAVMRSCQVYSLKVTHTGRHAGVVEAYNLGLGLEDIRHLGRWSMGQMEAFYAPRNPINGAFVMAHFKNEPYFIERDLVTPPLELQRKLFSWIEETFDVDHPELQDSWIKDCESQMKAVDPTVPTEDDLHFVPADSDSNEKTAKSLVQSAIVDRKAFLQLLVRLRRVILQDAVVSRKKDSQGRTLSNSLIDSRPDLFESPLFLQFEADLLSAMEKHRLQASLFPKEIAVDGEAVVGAVNGLADKVQQLTVTTSALQATLSHDRNQERMLEQIAHLRDLIGYSVDLQNCTQKILKVMSIPTVLPPPALIAAQQQQGQCPLPGSEPLHDQQGQGSGLLYWQPPLQQQPPPLQPPQQQPPQQQQPPWIQSSVHPSIGPWSQWTQPPAQPSSARPRPSRMNCKSGRTLKEIYVEFHSGKVEVVGDGRTYRRRKALFKNIEKLQQDSDKDMDTLLDELDQVLKNAASVEAFSNIIRERVANLK